MMMKLRNLFCLLGVLAVGPVLAQGQPATAAQPVTPVQQAAPARQSVPTVQVAQVSPDALLEMQAKKDASLLLLDVRTPEEFAAGHIPGAVNIPYDQVAARLSAIPKNDEVVLYCHSGRRAGLAAEVLAANGYTKLAHLEGDMQGWQNASRPVEAAPAPAPTK
jgi:rhodanese-related sulfurtransferase